MAVNSPVRYVRVEATPPTRTIHVARVAVEGVARGLPMALG